MRRVAIALTAAGILAGCAQSVSSPTALPNVATSARRDALLYVFKGPPDGESPDAGLTFGPSRSLLGTTAVGGLHEYRCGSGGCGTVFQLVPSASGYTEKIVYRFRGPAYNDGDTSTAALTPGKHGEFYGTTYSGGNNTLLDGTVFELTPSSSGYTETVLYRFPGYANDGVTPYATLARDASGTLYGTTSYGGQFRYGTVFSLTRGSAGYGEKVLHSFNFHDGAFPSSQLTIDANGTLYGAASSGGNTCGSSGNGCGVIFKLTNSGSTYSYIVIRNLSKRDGWSPSPGLLEDTGGVLYGTSGQGGPGGDGDVFELTPKRGRYEFKVLHSFTGGESPAGTLAWGPNGVIYGVTGSGGICRECGTVFKLAPSGNRYAFSTVYEFRGRDDGDSPAAGVIVGSSGELYGTTEFGPTHTMNFGTVYKVRP